jgi:endogenous inhibitor of DNA gyrase (YacG/DUF329 family)
MTEDTDAPRRCPICGKPTVAQHRPFCSRRCTIIDLGRWLKEDYRIRAADDPDETAEDDAES